jgi:hypothetical protein
VEFPAYYRSSNKPQSQTEPLPHVSELLAQPDPLGFLTKYVEALHVGRQIQQEQLEASYRQTKAEAKACNRLIAIILEHVKRQGVNPSELPNLKHKSYEQLCAYINEYWSELNNLV